MKKLISTLLAFGLALSLSHAAALVENQSAPAAAAADYVGVSELRGQSAERWTQTYETKWRNVQIDAKVTVPDVEALPVLLLGDGANQPLPAAEALGWEEAASSPFWVHLYNDWSTYPRKLDGKRLNQDGEAREVYQDGFSPENTYIPMSDLSFGEICGMVENAIVAVGYDPLAYDFRAPTRLGVSHLFYYGYKKDALPGGVSIDFRARVAGVPILSHIYQAVVDHYHGESRVDELQEFPSCLATYDAYDEKMHNLYLFCAKPVETVAPDVPLCSFQKVITAVEPEIKAGHIRKIFEAELGYVLYNETGVYFSRKEPMVEGRNTKDEMEAANAVRLAERAAARYYARPMWQINCLYVRSASGELRETSSYTMDERNTLDYYQLLVDAQTGELIGESDAQDRCEFKGFLSWEDVGGR